MCSLCFLLFIFSFLLLCFLVVFVLYIISPPHHHFACCLREVVAFVASAAVASAATAPRRARIATHLRRCRTRCTLTVAAATTRHDETLGSESTPAPTQRGLLLLASVGTVIEFLLVIAFVVAISLVHADLRTSGTLSIMRKLPVPGVARIEVTAV